MPGEKIRPLCNDPASVSIEHTLEEDAARGDLVRCGTTIGFTLADGKKDEVVTVMIRHKLVDFPGVNLKLVAGDRIEAGSGDGNSNTNLLANATKRTATTRSHLFIGVAHRNAKRTDDRIELCFIHD